MLERKEKASGQNGKADSTSLNHHGEEETGDPAGLRAKKKRAL